MMPARLARKRRRADDADDRVLPLINIVFLLLIFFMVAGRLVAGDPFKIEPPTSVHEGLPVADAMLLLIGADGTLALNGETMSEDRAVAAIARAASTQVNIKADGAAEAVAFVRLIERLKNAGVTSVTLMTVPRTKGVGDASR